MSFITGITSVRRPGAALRLSRALLACGLLASACKDSAVLPGHPATDGGHTQLTDANVSHDAGHDMSHDAGTHVGRDAGADAATLHDAGHVPSECDAASCAPMDDAGPDKACGARAGDSCTAQQYCAYVAGELCGAGDAEAACKPRPQICDTIYAPVCGCDRKTYSSECTAASAGQGVYSTGKCQ